MTAVSPQAPPGSPIGPGDVIADKYRVEAVVAMGGMGVVVNAAHLQLGHQVAIKVLLPGELTQDSNAVARFLREARAAASLQSEHVVRIHDVGTLPDGLPFMVMELLRGQDLRSLVRTRGPLGVVDAVQYVLQACDALGEAHEQGIVHRDLKPSNLFLAQRRDGSKTVKVLDFGISKVQPGLPGGTVELTTSTVMMGSPLYMSPEQVRDARTVDHRTDIWSLGVILYQLLTGKPPFNGESLPAVCAAIAADPPNPIERTDVPGGLQAVIVRCLTKRPGERFQSIGALASALEPFAPQAAAESRQNPLANSSANLGVLLEPTQRSSADIVIASSRGFVDADAHTVSSGGSSVSAETPGGMGGTARSARGDGPVVGVVAPTSWTRRRTALVAVACLLTVLVGIGLARLLTLRAGDPPAEKVGATTFSLIVTSEPSGATLHGGDGTQLTPAVLDLDREALAATPRQLRLVMPGYHDETWQQGAAEDRTKVHKVLRPIERAPVIVQDVPIDSPEAQRPAVKPAPVKPPPVKPGPVKPPPADIKLER